MKSKRIKTSLILILGAISLGVLVSFGSYLNNYFYNQKIFNLLSEDLDSWRNWRESENYSPIEISNLTFSDIEFGDGTKEWNGIFKNINFNKVVFKKCKFSYIGFYRSEFENVDFRDCEFNREYIDFCLFKNIRCFDSFFYNGKWGFNEVYNSQFKNTTMNQFEQEFNAFKECSFHGVSYWHSLNKNCVYRSCKLLDVTFNDVYV